jgi:hypothetical protein
LDEKIRKKALTLSDQHRIMPTAPLQPDDWPQATIVGYANEGLTLYFFCGLESQKATNLARDDRDAPRQLRSWVCSAEVS